MKKYFLNYFKKAIIKQYPNYSKEKIEEIMYGIEGIYLTITKCIIIFTIALLLGIFKELIFLLIAFNIIRTFAFGMHASNSIVCLIFSSLLFIGATFLCKCANIPNLVLYILYLISFIIILLYSPADTVKRPLIKKKKRNRFKIISCFVTILYFVISLIIKDRLIINSLILGLLIECILILPITYKIFKMPYGNYKKYGLNTK